MKFVKLYDNSIALEENEVIVFSWKNRDEIIYKWLNNLLDKEKDELFTRFMNNAKEIIIQSEIPDWEKKIVDWLIHWGYDKNLAKGIKKVHYELLEYSSIWDYYHARLYLNALFTDDSFNMITDKDREEKAKKFLFESIENLCASEDEKKYILKKSAEWFLKRYDLCTARKLFKASEKLERKQKNCKSKWIKKLIHNIWLLISKYILYLALPRMLSAIIIGYILLVMAEETWALAYNMWVDKWPIILTMLFSLVASFLYLCVEISKIGKHIKRRAFSIFFIGFVESIITGAIVNLIINRYYTPQKLSLDLSIWNICSWYYLQVILFFAPLALFIGIFVQIIWEDKPITHPL